MAEPIKCSRCGTNLPPGTPGGHCPQCLLNFGLGPIKVPDEPAIEEIAQPCDIPGVEMPLRRIGNYQLVRQIGEGGMGEVWLAEQVQPVRRQVALKIVKLGMDTKRILARFQAECQALALMDHPNIAKVFDAGATETGRPYLVMELVAGTKITGYCDQHQLPLPERLNLFIQVCLAVEHAHQKGILHRDLKPSNILVVESDGTPIPKVIDFGIAKAITGDSLTNKSTLFTAFEQFLGTPAYMSPEQAGLGTLDIDTRSDIYSLGVLLYELLAGRPPFDTAELKRVALDRLLQTIREKDPPPPSIRLTALAGEELKELALCRQIEPRKLQKMLRGELDWIVMKTLEKDLDRRYETANGLARDVERYLMNEPVSARPPGKLYILGKLLRRNRTAAGVALTIFLALAFGLVISIWGLGRENEARRLSASGLATEVDLRQKAEVPLQVAQAQNLSEAARYDQAEALLDKIPAELIEPSIPLAATYRKLGQWRASRNEWRRAAADFTMLQKADGLDDPQTSAADCLLAGPAFFACGSTNAYEEFRQAAIARFADTKDPVIIASVCRAILLLPADSRFMRRLDPSYDLATKSLNEETCGEDDARVCLALALMDYRRGDYTKAAKDSSRCLACGNGSTGPGGRPFPSPGIGRFDQFGFSGGVDACAARIILGMAHYRLGLRREAQFDLAYADARKPTDWAFLWRTNESAAADNYSAALLDWSGDSILWGEATNLLGGIPDSAVAAAVNASTLFETIQRALMADNLNDAQSTLGKIPFQFIHLEGSHAGALYFSLGMSQAVEHGWWRQAGSNWIVIITGPDGAGSLRDGQMYSGMYLRCAPVLLQVGDSAGYKKLRRFALANVSRPGEATDAEAVLLSCLLLPNSDPSAAAPLRTLAGVASHIDPGDMDWKPLADATLELLSFRLRDRARMEAWLTQTNHTIGCAAINAMGEVIAAQDNCEFNQIPQAESELALCRNDIESGYNHGLITGNGRNAQGIWFEWWMDRILFREAEARIVAASSHTITAAPLSTDSNR